MSATVGNPFAFNGDLSKFDIGRMLVREKVTLACRYPASSEGFRDYDIGIPAVPSGLDGYQYRPMFVEQASAPTIGGIYLSGFTIDSALSPPHTVAYMSVNTGSSTQSSGTANIDAYVYYVRKDIIRIPT